MSIGETPTFESLRDDLGRAKPASSRLERHITWVGGERKLAYARDEKGQLEMFLVCEELEAYEPVVRERMVHDSWETSDRSRLAANRLWLPAGDHYDAVAATILVELLERGFEGHAVEAFRFTEPLITLVLGQASAESAALTGLAGELLTLASLLRYAEGLPAEVLLDSWQGWGRSSRDFQLGPVGVEVKTSTTSASRHHIQGWYQLECGVSADGTIETDLYLLSIGIQWLPDESRGLTIEDLIKEITKRIPTTRSSGFLDSVRGYCGLRLDLDRDGRAGQASLRRPFISTYERLYDLRDDRIRLPRSADLAHFSDLISDTVTFELELPARVRGDLNPILGMRDALEMACKRLGGRSSNTTLGPTH